MGFISWIANKLGRKRKPSLTLWEDKLSGPGKIVGLSRMQMHLEGTSFSLNEPVGFIARDEGVYAIMLDDSNMAVGFGSDEEDANDQLVRTLLEVAYFDNDQTPLHRYLRTRMTSED